MGFPTVLIIAVPNPIYLKTFFTVPGNLAKNGHMHTPDSIACFLFPIS